MNHGWSLNVKDWERFFEFVNNLSWKSVHLRELDRDSVPKAPGVYTVCAKVGNIEQTPFSLLYNIVYIGQDKKSLRRRFLEHCQSPKKEIKEAIECFRKPLLYWYSKLEPSQIDEIESILIDCFWPSANIKRGNKNKISVRLKEGIPA